MKMVLVCRYKSDGVENWRAVGTFLDVVPHQWAVVKAGFKFEGELPFEPVGWVEVGSAGFEIMKHAMCAHSSANEPAFIVATDYKVSDYLGECVVEGPDQYPGLDPKVSAAFGVAMVLPELWRG